MRGKLIAICGIDACGKATQSKLLAERLNGHRIAFPRYETPVGAEILRNLKDEWTAAYRPDGRGVHYQTEDGNPVQLALRPHGTVNALVRQALFTFDRYLAAAEIESKLAAGTHVVLDRYWLSGVIFGASDGLDAKMLEAVHQRLPQPDLWLLLNVSPEESIKRRPERRDMYEKDTKSAWRRAKYLEFFALKQASTWKVLNGERNIDEVFATICAAVRGHFGRDVLDDKDLIAKGSK